MRRFLQDLSQYKKGNFNPRTHIGCDYLHSQASKLAYHFNPRTIVGQDVVCPHFLVPLLQDLSQYKKGNFNPRTHIGCDYLHSQASKLAYHFNPRTIVGQDVVCPHFLVPLFNPRTLRVKGYDTLNSYWHSVRFNPCIPVLLCY